MADHTDFIDYANKFEDMSTFSSHRSWQESTIAGKLTLIALKLGDNSLIRAIADALSNQTGPDGEDSPEARLLSIFANLGAVIGFICAAFAIGRIVQIFVGSEIVIHQEVIIEEEVKLSDLRKAAAAGDATETKDTKKVRRNARGKKNKSS